MRFFFLFIVAITPTLWAGNRPTTVEELFQTTDNLAIVSSPDRVEVCILYLKEPWFSKNLNKRKWKEGKPLPVSPETAQLLSTKLTDPKTYRWDIAKACWPNWNARISFFKSGHSVSADLCFSCKILLLSRDGQPFSGEDFDGANETIFEIVRSMFPDDRVIRDVLKGKEQQKEIGEQIKRAIELEKAKTAK